MKSTTIKATIAAATVIGLGIGSAYAAGSSDVGSANGSQTAPAAQYPVAPQGSVMPQQDPQQVNQYITSNPGQPPHFSTYDNNGQG
jgi:hypothetical protein